jgi:hypothetical protein
MIKKCRRIKRNIIFDGLIFSLFRAPSSSGRNNEFFFLDLLVKEIIPKKKDRPEGLSQK